MSEENKTDEEIVREIKMFGCTIEQLNEGANLTIAIGGPDQANGMLTMSILSDAQEVLKNDPETARQFINRAKYLISEKWMK